MRGWGVCKQVGDRWAGSIYEGGSRASVGTKPAPEMEPAQEWWARSSLYFILGRDWLQNRNVCYSFSFKIVMFQRHWSRSREGGRTEIFLEMAFKEHSLFNTIFG